MIVQLAVSFVSVWTTAGLALSRLQRGSDTHVERPSGTGPTHDMINLTDASRRATGLSEAEAQARLKPRDTTNCPRPDRRTPLRIVFEVLREPMFALLLGGGVIYLVLGDWRRPHPSRVRRPVGRHHRRAGDPHRTRARSAARSHQSRARSSFATASASASPAARWCAAISSCSPRAIAFPPTRCLLESHDLQTDESLLTGESVPVRKIATATARHRRSRRPAATICPTCFPARWSCAAPASPR